MQPYAPYPLNLLRDWLHRRRWPIRTVLAILLVPYAAQFTYTRWTGRPAEPPTAAQAVILDPSLAIPDPAVDRTADLVAAFNRLPALAPIAPPTTAPAGMRWITWKDAKRLQEGEPVYPAALKDPKINLDPVIALDGPWTPETRYHLRQVIDFLDLPEVDGALTDIAALSDKPSCIVSSRSTFGFHGLSEMRCVVKLLIARARYRIEQARDWPRAAQDIEAVLQLSEGLEDDQPLICMLIGIACRSLALSEMTHWSREHTLTKDEAQGLAAIIDRHRLDRQWCWNTAMRGELLEREFRVDQMYTRDDHDAGWLVLSSTPARTQGDLLLGLLNLLSPFFASRQTVEERLARCFGHLQDDGMLSCSAMIARWGETDYLSPRPTLPWSEEIGVSSRAYLLLGRTQAYEVGAITSLALSAYRADHNEYPDDLAGLVPDYLSAVPPDPLVDQPLRYRITDDGSYILYSVDQDGLDSGGVRGLQTGSRGWEELDFPLSEPRSEPAQDEEWVLVPEDKLPTETVNEPERVNSGRGGRRR